jgi:hypothetical protein
VTCDQDRSRTTADAVAEAVLACPAVAALVDGPVATFLPGRRVRGVRVDDDLCTVAVAVRPDGRPLPEIAADVRRAASTVVGGRPVDVLVADLVTELDVETDAGDEDEGER